MTHKSKIYVAMSGGVDSSVTAALLKERGFSPVGVHIKMWSDSSIPCQFKEDRYDAMRVAEYLKIPFQTWDLTKEYKRAVVDYMIDEYAALRTPNPDVMCNRHIKFGAFLKKALDQGADFVATGHYVRVVPSPHPLPLKQGGDLFNPPNVKANDSPLSSLAKGGARVRGKNSEFQLLKGVDSNKDQSYFLWTLTQKQLRYCLFPVGEYIKPGVRAMAKEFGLPTAEKKDSQGICFIGKIDLRNFLKNYIPTQSGQVLTTAGKTIGEHEGLQFYTIGQREGLGIGGGIPYYVADKNFKTNTLVVAEGPYDQKLFSRELTVSDVNWISGKAPKLPLKCEARIRYRQPLQECRVYLSPHFTFHVLFKEPQRAVTPGQSIVFYREDEMLGGGIIADAVS